MQDKSAPSSGFVLRVAASFNTAVKAAPFGRWTLEMPKLRNICLLLLIAIASQLVIAMVVAITGLPYRQASLLTLGVVLAALVIAVLYLAVRSRRENIQAATAMRNIQELQAAQQALIPTFRKYAEGLEDRQARSEILQHLDQISRSTELPPDAALTDKTQPNPNASITHR